MSQVINNREYRQQVLKELIKELHNGKSVDEVKERFHNLIHDISTKEISEMEAALVKEGMKVEEIQRLCDVHASVFKGSIEEVHHPENAPGHPLHTFKLENKEVKKYINEDLKRNIEQFTAEDNKENRNKLLENFNMLSDLDKHYKRKENLLFPYIERYGITAPPKVMWGVDDEIRKDIKDIKSMLRDNSESKESIISKIGDTSNKIIEMIFKEENILFTLSSDTLSEDEWMAIEADSDSIGYCFTGPDGKWKPERVSMETSGKEKIADENSKGYIKFDTGILKAKEIGAIFDHMPVDITFVDKDGIVKYFSNSKERIFPRTRAVIGRDVSNCHPPASVHVVEKLLDDLKNGSKDHEDFWIKMGPMYVYIRYFAVRDENGEFLGTLEVSQDIKPIQEINGEKRLMDD